MSEPNVTTAGAAPKRWGLLAEFESVVGAEAV